MAAKIINLKTLLLSAGVILAVELGLHWVAWPKNISSLVLLGIARVLEGLILLATVQLFCPRGTAAIGLRFRNFSNGLKKGLVWSAGFGILVLLVSIILYLTSGINAFEIMQSGRPTAKGGIWLFLIIGGVVASTLATLLVMPVLYLVFAAGADRQPDLGLADA